ADPVVPAADRGDVLEEDVLAMPVDVVAVVVGMPDREVADDEMGVFAGQLDPGAAERRANVLILEAASRGQLEVEAAARPLGLPSPLGWRWHKGPLAGAQTAGFLEGGALCLGSPPHPPHFPVPEEEPARQDGGVE